MMAVLPLFALFLAICWCRHAPPARCASWPEATVRGACLWGVLLVVGTELLSQGGAVTPLWLSLYWSGLAALGLFALHRLPRLAAPAALTPGPGCRLCTAAAALSIAIAGLVAFLAPPNNLDGYVYHLMRVIHWQHQGSVAHYPTHILRQLQFGPGAEYVVLHLTVLADSDIAANLPQWLALAGSAAAAVSVATGLGVSTPGARFAAVLIATIPMAILQASSTQNDLVEGFWLLCLADSLLAWRRAPSWPAALAAGASLGLAVLTKGLALVYAPPLLLCLLAGRLRELTHHRRQLVAATLLALLLLSGFFGRNYALFGHPLGPLTFGETLPRSVRNELYTPSALISNLARNSATHLMVNFNPRLAAPLRAGLHALHRQLGLSMMDQRTTWGGFMVIPFDWTFWDESYAGNPLHFLLALAATIGLVAQARRDPSRRAAALLALSAAAAFVLYCGLIKVQYYQSRLHLPLFLLAAPCGAAWLGTARPRALTAAALLFAGFAVPVHLYNHMRPLLGPHAVYRVPREDQYYCRRPALRAAAEGAAHWFADQEARHIGLHCHWDGLEYPYYRAARRALGPELTWTHWNVTNVSQRLCPPQPAAPDAILSLYLDPPETLQGSQAHYRLARRFQGCAVYTRTPQSKEPPP